MTSWSSRAQQATVASAVRHGEGWTSSELELVAAFGSEVSAVELAEAAGRTLFAVQSMKQAVRAGKRVGSGRVAASDRPYRGWLEGQGE